MAKSIRRYHDPDTIPNGPPLSDDQIRVLALRALAVSPPTSPDDWAGVYAFIRARGAGRDARKVLQVAQQQINPHIAKTRDLQHARRGRPTLFGVVKSQQHGFEGYQCRYCGKAAEAVDHAWPRSRGGDDHSNNLVPVCKACNSLKNAQSWMPDACPSCGAFRDPSDVVTATGMAYYACRCGSAWAKAWDLQRLSMPKQRTSPW